MEISGIPLHPLVVHAAVVFAPLAALTALGYALVPRWRWWLRWPLVAVTVVAVGSAVVAAISGQALLESRVGLESLPAVQDHMAAGKLLRNLMLGFGAVALLAVWRLGGTSPLTAERPGEPSGVGEKVIAGVLVLASVGVLAAAIRAGHTGATAVWGS